MDNLNAKKLEFIDCSKYPTKEQQEKIDEFLTSKCDMFSSADFHYYAEVTGKGIDWTMDNAKYHDNNGINGTCLENAMLDGDFELGDFLI